MTVKVQGEGWAGSWDTASEKAQGYVNGCAWLLVLKNSGWLLEISEESGITPEQLPLVGYGCSGWLSEIKLDAAPSVEVVTRLLEAQFLAFSQGKLQYYPAVNCSCSDE